MGCRRLYCKLAETSSFCELKVDLSQLVHFLEHLHLYQLAVNTKACPEGLGRHPGKLLSQPKLMDWSLILMAHVVVLQKY